MSAIGEFPEPGYIAAVPLGPDNEPVWNPRADIFLNSDGEFTIKVELAALRREDIEVNRDGQRVFVEGRRSNGDARPGECKYLSAEISWGRFELAVDVPPNFDLNQASARYENGLLQVVVPRTGRF